MPWFAWDADVKFCVCTGAPGILNQTPAASGTYAGGAPVGAQLGGLDLMAILQNAGVHPVPQPQPGVKQEPPPSIQVSIQVSASFKTASPLDGALLQFLISDRV